MKEISTLEFGIVCNCIHVSKIIYCVFWTIVNLRINKDYHTVVTVMQSKKHIVERGTIDMTNTQIYMTAHFTPLPHLNKKVAQ